MVSQEVIVTNPTGLHGRPASILVTTASKFKSDIDIIKDGSHFNAKSIMSVMGSAVAQGYTIGIQADGVDEEQAVETLVTLIKNEFK